jgi:hypothetical protein
VEQARSESESDVGPQAEELVCVAAVGSDAAGRRASMYGNAFGQPPGRGQENAWHCGFAEGVATAVFGETWTPERIADELLDEATAEVVT